MRRKRSILEVRFCVRNVILVPLQLRQEIQWYSIWYLYRLSKTGTILKHLFEIKERVMLAANLIKLNR